MVILVFNIPFPLFKFAFKISRITAKVGFSKEVTNFKLISLDEKDIDVEGNAASNFLAGQNFVIKNQS